MHDAPDVAVLASGRPVVDGGLHGGGDGLEHLKNKVGEKSVQGGHNRACEAAQTQGKSTAGSTQTQSMHAW